MSDDAFDLDAWLDRIGMGGSREPTLATSRGVIRVTIRRPGDRAERFRLDNKADFQAALHGTFGLTLAGADLSAALEALETSDRKGTRGITHPFFS